VKKVILTTGGTGGHIYPALAVAHELKERGIETLFVGTSTRMEKKLVPDEGYRFIGIDIYPPRTLKNIFKFIKGIIHGIKIIKKENPDAIIGFGNYISVPVLLAGVIFRKPIYLQEQNANLGMTNKIFYKFAKKTFLAFDKTFDEMPLKYQHLFMVTGNPLRDEIYTMNYQNEREKLKLQDDEKLLLITGGSLGAKDINEGVIKNWERIYENKKIRVYWATGEKNYEEIWPRLEKIKISDTVKPYFNNMIQIMTAADLVVCRAGALTLSEIIELEKPSILIPYNSIKVGQYENAKILEERNAALIYPTSDASSGVEKALDLIENKEELLKIKVKIKALKKGKAAETIARNLDIWRN
jgi:UDP-N-acetylglucosamine--N-acetylmuramyl-(pentapeptide) pyrophosphoryl-undecaprenol N-acetylglucosamine transferase